MSYVPATTSILEDPFPIKDTVLPIYLTHPKNGKAHIALTEAIRQGVIHGQEPRSKLAQATRPTPAPGV